MLCTPQAVLDPTMTGAAPFRYSQLDYKNPAVLKRYLDTGYDEVRGRRPLVQPSIFTWAQRACGA